MRRFILTVAVLALAVPAVASASGGLPSGYHECQHPVITGVEVFKLKAVTAGTACPVALALSRWEPKHDNAARLYGCHRKNPDSGGYPYLKLHVFDGWQLSLTGPTRYGAFTMSRGTASFEVTGTDFPLNCS